MALFTSMEAIYQSINHTWAWKCLGIYSCDYIQLDTGPFLKLKENCRCGLLELINQKQSINQYYILNVNLKI